MGKSYCCVSFFVGYTCLGYLKFTGSDTSCYRLFGNSFQFQTEKGFQDVIVVWEGSTSKRSYE